MECRIFGACVLLTVLSAAGCGSDPAGPAVIESDSLAVAASVDPGRMAAGDSARVRVAFHNRTDEPLVLGFGMGCAFYLEVVAAESDEPVAMEGSRYGCTAVFSAIEVPARDSVVREQPLVARVAGLPARAGSYVARLDFTNGIWDLEIPFTVQ